MWWQREIYYCHYNYKAGSTETYLRVITGYLFGTVTRSHCKFWVNKQWMPALSYQHLYSRLW